MEKTLTENITGTQAKATGTRAKATGTRAKAKATGTTEAKAKALKDIYTPKVLDGWDTFTEEQQTTLSQSIKKSKNGSGGEHFSTFPTLLDKKINTWAEEKYNTNKLGKISQQQFKTWEANGTLQILPLIKGEKTHYLITILPNQNIKMDLWELEKEGTKPFLKYTTHNLLGEITLTNKHYHILNGYTNKNKALNQSKLLVKLFQLGTDISQLIQEKELNIPHLQMDIQDGKIIFREISKNTKKPTGKIYQSIGDYLGREPHQNIKINYLELIN